VLNDIFIVYHIPQEKSPSKKEKPRKALEESNEDSGTVIEVLFLMSPTRENIHCILYLQLSQ
jgi:hypothetical protein